MYFELKFCEKNLSCLPFYIIFNRQNLEVSRTESFPIPELSSAVSWGQSYFSQLKILSYIKEFKTWNLFICWNFDRRCEWTTIILHDEYDQFNLDRFSNCLLFHFLWNSSKKPPRRQILALAKLMMSKNAVYLRRHKWAKFFSLKWNIFGGRKIELDFSHCKCKWLFETSLNWGSFG